MMLSVQCNHQEAVLDIQGHRGARGLVPENTVPSFIYALEAGVTTMEMDVVVSADGKLVVSHEPWMSSEICSHPDGTPVAKAEEPGLNLYKMSYDSIAKYDCGSRGNEKFPRQEKMAVSKPLLSTVMDTIETLVKAKKLDPVGYNIETKSTPDGDGAFHPAPAEFVKLLLREVQQRGIEDRVVIQSFDVRTLQEVKRQSPGIKLALLISAGDFATGIEQLGFAPDIYSPNYRLVDQAFVERAHEEGMKVIPWTVNDLDEMKKLLDDGVDGIITDYPDIAVKLKNRTSAR